MYGDRQLAELAQRKLVLEARITVRRLECVMAGARLAPPIALLDSAWSLWRQLSPWVKLLAVPLGLFARRKFTKVTDGAGRDWLAMLLGALPTIISTWKSFRAQNRAPEPEMPDASDAPDAPQ